MCLMARSDDEDGDNEAVHWDRGGFADVAATLFAHQRAAVRWMMKVERSASLRGGILADEMGLGKTISDTTALGPRKPLRALYNMTRDTILPVAI